MNREVVFDIETTGDIKNFDTLKVTIVSVYDYETQMCRSFLESELSQLWPIFEKADRLIGYNSDFFDIPILNKYYTGDLTKFPSLDLLKVIKESTGTRFKLDEIAKATLQIQKSGDGLQAMKWFEEGNIEKLREYCEQDVRVTKEIYEYGRKNKMLYYTTLAGQLMPLPVNFDPILRPANTVASSGLNMTLPI